MTIYHHPTLETLLMIEKAIEENSNKLTRYQLWLKLPRKIMYQTYLLILRYLEKSSKITIKDKKLVWIAKLGSEKLFKPQFTLKKRKEKMKFDSETEKLLESLNPDEREILQYLDFGEVSKIVEASGLEEIKILRALQYLTNKKIANLESSQSKMIILGENGILYKTKGLPERVLLNYLEKHQEVLISQAANQSNLSDNEFKAALGVLKGKALILMEKGKIKLNAKKQEIEKKFLEEQFLESLPIALDSLKPEQKLALENLKSRKQIIEIKDEKTIKVILTELGKKLTNADLSKFQDLIENLTPEIIREDSWKGKKFRRYDISSPVPAISGGKRHFVNQAKDYARKVWTELGFKEMSSSLTQTGFWNFDALYTAQDHPVREIQDTFYLPVKGKLPKNYEEVKKAHEQGISGSSGWKYKWNEEEAKKVILRTHTTCLSVQTLAKLRELKDKTGKFFAVGKCFRNETIDWSHGFEFNQTEGIVVDKNANFRNLLGYLKEFYKKMGFEEVKFVPSYFPYTEPSVEIYGYNKQKNVWIEIGGAGIFRPEVVVPLLGEYIPVLAWGPGFDRSIMEYYEIKDLREMYKNDLNQLRKMKIWLK